MAAIAEQLEELRTDREHGASWMARRAVEALVDVAQDDFETGEQMLARLVEVGRELADSRPGIGSIAGALGRVLAAAQTHRALKPTELRRLIAEEAHGVVDARRRAAASIAILLRERVAGRTIVTHSASATVREALAQGRPEHVICTVSSPGEEGLRLAGELRESGLEVEVVDDEAAPQALNDASLVLVGADTVFRCGTLCNKVGTYDLVQAASDVGIPTVVAAEVIKLAPITSAEAPDLGGAAASLFDLTPPELVECVVTEEGAYPVEDLGALIDRIPFLRPGYALLRGA